MGGCLSKQTPVEGSTGPSPTPPLASPTVTKDQTLHRLSPSPSPSPSPSFSSSSSSPLGTPATRRGGGRGEEERSLSSLHLSFLFSSSTGEESREERSLSSLHLSSLFSSPIGEESREETISSCSSPTNTTISSSLTTTISSSSSSSPCTTISSSSSPPSTTISSSSPSTTISPSPSSPSNCFSSTDPDSQDITDEDITEETSAIDRIPAVPETEELGPEVTTLTSGTVAKEDASLDLQPSGSLERSVEAAKSSCLCSFFCCFRRNSQKRQLKKLGLPNIGNTCFMNATLQALYSLPDFCSDVMSQEVLWSPQTQTSLKLHRDIGELHKARQGLSSSRGKRKLLQNEEYRDDDEQDAHEFLMLLLTEMKSEGKMLRGKSTSLGYICPAARFNFKLQSVRTCSSCGDKVYQKEKHKHLSLDIQPCLKDSLGFFFKASELRCTCLQCCGLHATMTRSFLTLPRVLVLHMKRFSYDRGHIRKVDDDVDIPPVLSLTSIFDQEVMATLRGSSSDEQLVISADRENSQQGASVEDHQSQSTYRLTGVVSHLGESIDSGHYISDILEDHRREWLTLDDSHVTKTDEATVLEERSDSAYILFYVLSGEAEEGEPSP